MLTECVLIEVITIRWAFRILEKETFLEGEDMKILLFFTFMAVAAITAIDSVSAYTIPENNSKIEYLYVTGPEGDPLRGAEDHRQVLHIDVPEGEQGEVKIGIFDPDTGGKVDARPSSDNPWNTKTEITVSGGNGEIYNEVFK